MEQISLGHQYKECRPRRSSSCPTKILVGKDLLKELEQRRSSPSVIAKLMGIDVLPPAYIANNRHQEFKDVFEVSEEPPEAVTKERPHHFPKGLPSLKRSALKLKKLMPSKSPYDDETFDNNVEYRNGLGRLNSLEINNPLFEKRPNDVSYSLNHQYEKDTASTFRKYPVGLANSSLRDISNSSRGNHGDFNSIVVLEPGLGKGYDAENSLSMPYHSHVDNNCRRDSKQKQAEFAVLNKERVSQHLLDTEDVNVSRIKRERYLTSNGIDPLLKGQESSFDQFNMVDMNITGSPQRYASGDVNSRQSNKSSSNSSPWKICRKYEEADAGSKTLAEMFALSDSERPKRNLDSHVQIRHNKLDRGNGHSKEGCFIVLPKHAPPLPLHCSLDRSSPLEQRRPTSPSHDDSRSHSWRLADNFSTSDFLIWLAIILGTKGFKEVEQPSPVSILEPPTDEDSCSGYFKYDLQDMPNVRKQIDDCQLRDEPEVSMSSDDDNDSSYQSLEAFQVEEDRDFSYLLDILISSGMIVTDWQLLCKSWHLPGCPVGPHIFDRLERKYNKIATWAKPERRLLFDLANSVLSEVLAPWIDVHSWVNSRRQCRPIWGPEGPVEKVWQMMVRQQEELAIGHPGDKVLDPNWLEVGDDINMVGKQIARMLYGDLLEEVMLEFLSGLVVS